MLQSFNEIKDQKNDFTDEQQQRYDDIKEKTTRIYPHIYKDPVQRQFSECLYRYYALNGEVPK
jgi:hypothetical protein